MKSEKGFSLIELLMGIVLVAILTGGLSSVIFSITRSYETSRATVEAKQTAEAVLDFCVRELRTAQRFEVSGASANQITFVNANDDQVTYSINHNTGTLNRIVNNLTTEPLGGPVTHWQIDYFDYSALQLDETHRFDSITLDLTVTSTDGSVSYSRSATIRPRSISGVADPNNLGWVN
jgi:prepilin-type N-terminal cleavage/methylation domain-containing protein